jgi:hypothetical protein
LVGEEAAVAVTADFVDDLAVDVGDGEADLEGEVERFMDELFFFGGVAEIRAAGLVEGGLGQVDTARLEVLRGELLMGKRWKARRLRFKRLRSKRISLLLYVEWRIVGASGASGASGALDAVGVVIDEKL